MTKIAAALIAATMFVTPAFAQGTAPAASTPMTQPAKAAVAKPKVVTDNKSNVVTVKKHHAKRHHVKKHMAKPAKHIRNVRHAKPSKVKPTDASVTHTAKTPAASSRTN
jgi:uncharacterized protein YfcZ (UPF0381/DUF406 family)